MWQNTYVSALNASTTDAVKSVQYICFWFLLTVLRAGEREGGMEEEVCGDVRQSRSDEAEARRATELPVRAPHGGGELEERPGNILLLALIERRSTETLVLLWLCS